MSYLGLALIRLIGLLPLPWVRAVGTCLGYGLYVIASKRRHVVETNLKACLPEFEGPARSRLVRGVFVRFAQAWMDRGWLWHGSRRLLGRRIGVTGNVQALKGARPTLLFAPHFVGLDAGWTALSLHAERPLATLYMRQVNPVVDRWISKGRLRWGRVRLQQREDGAKPLVAALRAGELLYLLPDMNFGERESIFVPFFGVQAATVTSLSRLARLGRAEVVTVVTRMTARGYEVELGEPWPDFPSDDVPSDTSLMNSRLETLIRSCPDQYFWVHRRFKSRPVGEASLY